MPVRELPFRVSEQLTRAAGRRVHDVPGAGPRVPTGLAGLVLPWAAEPGVADDWARSAEALARGEVSVFGNRWPVDGDGVPLWDVDPVTGYVWPQDYCFDVPMTPDTGELVEVKHVWELNRLVHLIPVAAHAATRDDADAARLVRLHLRRWLAEHPPRRGVVWRSGIELAIRVLAMVTVLELLPPDPELDAEVGQAVAEHADWIRRFPSRHSSANNHRVAELTGLLVAGAAYPRLAGDDDAAELDALVLDQFCADGVPAEQATMYGFLVLEWLAVRLHLAGEVPPATRARIEAAVRFLVTVTDGAGHAVRFGDDDDTRLLTAARPHGEYARAVLQLAADGLGTPLPPAATGLTTFPDGGYTVWRGGTGAHEVLWVLDHGPLGMGSLAAHGHADTLAVYLHVGGRPVLVDAGTYLYHGAGADRDRLRGTAEHNTVTVGGESSSLPAGPFNWRRGARAEGRLVSARSETRPGDGGWSVVAEHDGYLGRSGVRHRRTLAGSDGTFTLTDELEGGCHVLPVRWSLLVAPGVDVVPTPGGWALRADGRDLLTLSLPTEHRARDDAAWCSPAFARTVATRRLSVETEFSGTWRLTARLTVPPTSHPVHQEAEQDQS